MRIDGFEPRAPHRSHAARAARSLVFGMLLAGVSVAAEGPAPVPVWVGGEEALDACPSTAVVSGLRPSGFLAVRSGPGTGYTQLDELHNDDPLQICATSPDGLWYGVVYGGHGDIDCGVASPITPKRPYTGPCASGWVYTKWVVVIAG